MTSFFDEIARNRLKSLALMAVFFALFVAVIAAVVWLFGGGLFALFMGVAIVTAYAVYAYFFGYKTALWLGGAKTEADRKQYASLYSTVEGLALAAQIPVPKVYVVDDPSPNAFATGRNKKIAAVVVTSGLLAMMDRRELQGVLSHELSHIYNGDIQLMTLAVVFAGVIGIIAVVLRSTLLFGGIGMGGGRGRNSEGGALLLIFALILGIIAPFVALLIRLAISRKREYMADANGARMIRDPSALASALKKLQAYSANPKAQPTRHANEVTASMYISNPFNMKGVGNLFSTHPPIEDRIKKLEQMY
jgi:heat shock protein HtpX